MDQLLPSYDVLGLPAMMDIASKAVGLTFFYAVASKLSNIPGFLAGIRGYDLVPDRLAPFVAVSLLMGEFSIALTHVGGFGLKIAVPATILLLFAFLFGVASLLKRGRKAPCLCFGANPEDEIDVYTLARIALLVLIELALYAYLVFDNGARRNGAEGNYDGLGSLAVATLALTLIAWCFSIPKFRRAWHVLNS